eukprot:4508875-Pyramimonas_sp.AAC.1
MLLHVLLVAGSGKQQRARSNATLYAQFLFLVPGKTWMDLQRPRSSAISPLRYQMESAAVPY